MEEIKLNIDQILEKILDKTKKRTLKLGIDPFDDLFLSYFTRNLNDKVLKLFNGSQVPLQNQVFLDYFVEFEEVDKEMISLINKKDNKTSLLLDYSCYRLRKSKVIDGARDEKGEGRIYGNEPSKSIIIEIYKEFIGEPSRVLIKKAEDIDDLRALLFMDAIRKYHDDIDIIRAYARRGSFQEAALEVARENYHKNLRHVDFESLLLPKRTPVKIEPTPVVREKRKKKKRSSSGFGNFIRRHNKKIILATMGAVMAALYIGFGKGCIEDYRKRKDVRLEQNILSASYDQPMPVLEERREEVLEPINYDLPLQEKTKPQPVIQEVEPEPEYTPPPKVKPKPKKKKPKKRRPKPKTYAKHWYYVVQRHDTLSKISRLFTDSTSNYHRLARDNKISNPNLIEVGQVIKIPDSMISNFSGLINTAFVRGTKNTRGDVIPREFYEVPECNNHFNCESLVDIARKVTGNSNNAYQILNYNRRFNSSYNNRSIHSLLYSKERVRIPPELVNRPSLLKSQY